MNITFYNGTAIDPNKNYTVASSGYCWGGGDDFGTVLKTYTIRNLQKYGEMRLILY